jgi:hypothetical protein
MYEAYLVCTDGVPSGEHGMHWTEMLGLVLSNNKWRDSSHLQTLHGIELEIGKCSVLLPTV